MPWPPGTSSSSGTARDGGERGLIQGIKVRRSVFNDERYALRVDAEFDVELLGGVADVAVADDVGKRFFKAEFDGKGGAFRELMA